MKKNTKIIVGWLVSIIIAIIAAFWGGSKTVNQQTQTVIVNSNGQEVSVNEQDFQKAYNELEEKYIKLQQENSKLKKVDESSQKENDLNDIGIQKITFDKFLDGKLVTTSKDIIVFDDVIYISLDDLGALFNKTIEVDSANNSLFIGDKPGEAYYLGEQIKAYSTGYAYNEYPDSGSFDMAGITYYSGVTSTVGGTGYDSSGYYNLDKKFTNIKGFYGPNDDTQKGSSTTILFYCDDKLTLTLETAQGDMPKEFSLDITNVSQLKIEFVTSSHSAPSFALADVVIY